MKNMCFMIVELETLTFGKHFFFHYGHFLCLLGHYLCVHKVCESLKMLDGLHTLWKNFRNKLEKEYTLMSPLE